MKKSILVIVGLMSILILLAFSLLQIQQEVTREQQIKNLDGTKTALLQTITAFPTIDFNDFPPRIVVYGGEIIYITLAPPP